MTRLFGLAALVGLATACATASTMQTASTVGAGKLQAAVEPSVSYAANGTEMASGAVTSLGIRYGLTNAIDIGGRFGAAGTELHTKIAFTKHDSPVQLSIAPSVAAGLGFGNGNGGAVKGDIPLLLGLPIGAAELVIGGRAAEVMVVQHPDIGDDTVWLPYVGGVLGAKLPPTGKVTPFPEVAVLWPMTDKPWQTHLTPIPRGPILSFGVGILLGSQTR